MGQTEFNASNVHGNEKFQRVIFPNKSGKSLKYLIEQKIILLRMLLSNNNYNYPSSHNYRFVVSNLDN